MVQEKQEEEKKKSITITRAIKSLNVYDFIGPGTPLLLQQFWPGLWFTHISRWIYDALRVARSQLQVERKKQKKKSQFHANAMTRDFATPSGIGIVVDIWGNRLFLIPPARKAKANLWSPLGNAQQVSEEEEEVADDNLIKNRVEFLRGTWNSHRQHS